MFSPIKFVERTNQIDYVKIVNKGGYWSYVGKQGGEQHSHPDRDKYLFVQNNSYDYRRYEPNDVRCFGNYDFKSIMHYPLGSCMKLKSEVKRDFEIGQREMLSEGDIKAINMLYLDSTPDIQRVKITASNEEMKLQFLLKIKSKIFRRKRSQ
ncbi:hypothetical protein RhiirA5_369319 [Rhizophagus irregularis]|uniref:Metalloendopeptidase n=2 Tax=Rhizophagus irregularis TaxID=588596 RepID=A0A2N0QDD0_9GLOM|nr:hypothetical protein RhiirA5_369319 [Rhizophagus irregularis]